LACVFDWQKRITKEVEMTIKRISDVLQAFGFRSRTTVYKNIQLGLFTRPIAIGQRAVGWLDTEVEVITLAVIAGQPQDEIKRLVDRLHAQRLEKFESMGR
jgi:prophage regulatory protein